MADPICTVCKKPIQGAHPTAKAHKGECYRAMERARWREKQRRKKAQTKEEWRQPRPCSECGKLFDPKNPRQETCAKLACIRTRKKRLEKLRAQGVYQRDQTLNAFNEYQMPDPWPGMDTMPPGCVSWYQAEMMPLM